MAGEQDPAQDASLHQLLALGERGLAAVEELLAVLRAQDREMIALLEHARRLEALVWTDPQTGLLNRRGLAAAMRREEARARRYHAEVAVALVEATGLATAGMQHGPDAAGMLVRTVAAAVQDSARGSDIAARIAPAVFAAVLPGANADGARMYLSRATAAAQYLQAPDGAFLPIILRTAVATREEAGSLESALEQATRRLARGAPLPERRTATRPPVRDQEQEAGLNTDR